MLYSMREERMAKYPQGGHVSFVGHLLGQTALLEPTTSNVQRNVTNEPIEHKCGLQMGRVHQVVGTFGMLV